jgi:hypothetical protein
VDGACNGQRVFKSLVLSRNLRRHPAWRQVASRLSFSKMPPKRQVFQLFALVAAGSYLSPRKNWLPG